MSRSVAFGTLCLLALLLQTEAQVPSSGYTKKEVVQKTQPSFKPPDLTETMNLAPPLPPQLEDSHPTNFPTARFPSDPPILTPRDSSNNVPFVSGQDSPHPPGRWLHSMTTYLNKLYVYGGVANSASLLNDLWMFDYSGTSWLQLDLASAPRIPGDGEPLDAKGAEVNVRPPDIPAPPPMARAPGVPPPGRTARPQGTVSEMKTVHLASMPSASPAGVYAQSVDQIASFLQLDASAQPLPSDVWEYDVVTRMWSQLDMTTLPPARWLHTAVSLGKDMVVFGGTSNNMLLLNDVWMMNYESPAWNEVTVSGEKPDPREGHAAVSVEAEDESAVVVFGGVSYSYAPMNDLWKLTVADGAGTWAKIDIAADESPPARWMHTMDLVTPETIVLFGGCSSKFAPLNDLWVLSTSEQAWTKIEAPRGYPPTARWLHSSAVVVSAEGAALIVHGGAANNIYFDDMWIFYAEDQSWVEAHPASDAPIPREGHKLVAIGVREAANVTDTSSDSDSDSSPSSRRLLAQNRLRGDPSIPAPFRMDPPQPKREERRGAARKRPSTRATVLLALFGGAGERGLVASEQERFQTQ